MKTRRRRFAALFGLLGAILLGAVPSQAETPFITVASTTSTEQSGLFAHLLPAFTAATGIEGARSRGRHRPGAQNRRARRRRCAAGA